MSGPRTNSGLLLSLDRTSGEPMHRQITRAIRDGIRTGRLVRDTVLPPSRVLAADLGVSRGVVVEAYQQLVAEGYLATRTGGHTKVIAGPAAAGPARPELTIAPRVDLGYGRADVSNFPRLAWLRSLRTALAGAPNEVFGYLSGSGVPQLKTAIADYTNRVRAAAATAQQVVICTGYAQGAALVVGVLDAAGTRTIAVEDPSSGDDALPAAHAAGLNVVGIPVDDQGLRVDLLERSAAEAVFVTPSHQWPTGAVLSAARRAELLDWARRRDAIVVKDDYDAEYCHDGLPAGALQGEAPDHVILAGSVSKTLAPGLRIGWLIAPPRLASQLAEAKIAADRGSPAPDQLALADFITRGEFDRHLRRMRPKYRRRRDTLLAALREHLPDCQPAGFGAGLHMIVWLPLGLDEQDVVAAALRRGVVVEGIGPYRLRGPGRPGLILGYATLGADAIVDGTRLLAMALDDCRRRR